jgi:cytosine/adenosine deaminase-related metal-dependent hydrolase
MKTLLLLNIDELATFNEARDRLRNAWLLLRGNQIDSFGKMDAMIPMADEVMDLRGFIVMPGMINTHHHLFQSLLRNIPILQDVSLFDWLYYMYLLMSEVTDEDQYVAALVNHAELLLSGCTTTVDHAYLRVNDMRFDTSVKAAQDAGIRFHLARGSFSVGQSAGGLPPDHIIEKEEDILADTERLIKTYHDAGPLAMTRVDNAPCSPFSVSLDLMRESIAMAREYGIGNHTHFAESPDDERYVQEKFGMRSVELAQELGWVGPDVWYAHGVTMNDSDIKIMGRTKTAVAHCPNSNMYTAAGCCPVKELLQAGATIGIGVDGSAANNASNMLDEVRNMLLLQRAFHGADALSPTQALEIATLGGARLLRRDDLGVIEAGKAADLIGVRYERLSFAGGVHDPLAGLVLCDTGYVDLSIVNGQIRVKDGCLVDLDTDVLIKQLNQLSKMLVERVEKRYQVTLTQPVWRKAYPYEGRS